MRTSGSESVHHSPARADRAAASDEASQVETVVDPELGRNLTPTPPVTSWYKHPEPSKNLQQQQDDDGDDTKRPLQRRRSQSADQISYCPETVTDFAVSYYEEEQEEEDGIRKQEPQSTTEKQRHKKHNKSNKLPNLKRMLVRNGKEYDTGARSFTSSDDDDTRNEDAVVPPLFMRQESQDIDSVTGNWSIEDLPSPVPRNGVAATTNNNRNNTLTLADIAMCRALDLEYERALEDRQVAWTARYQSVRQSTVFSVLFMFILIMTGTVFFLRQADPYWTFSEGLLFSIYTVTTVGYGHLETPTTPTFQMYTICFIFLGIAMLTILVAQVYQCISLEAGRVVMSASSSTSRNHRNGGMRRWLEARLREQRALQHQQQQQMQQQQQSSSLPVDSSSMHSHPYYGNNSNTNHRDMEELHSLWNWADFVEWVLQNWDSMRTFLKENELGRAISVVIPFAVLITLGAAVIGPLEGWTVVESIYFAVVSLTTVGFGDYYPTRPSSIWFCCLWLPFSVGFMSLYLAHVAAFYIRLSDRNVTRIERVLRRRMQRAKERAEQERRAVLRRAYRGQELSSHVSNITDDDDNMNNSGEWVGVSVPPHEAAETGRGNMKEPPPEVENDHPMADGTMIVTVDHNAHQRDTLRSTAGRSRRGFNAISTLEDESPNVDALEGDSAVGVIEPTSTASTSKHLFGAHGSVSQRRERILQNSIKHTEFEICDDGGGKIKHSRISSSMATMKDVLYVVHRNNDTQTMLASNHGRQRPRKQGDAGGMHFPVSGPDSQFLSVHSNQTVLQNDRRTVSKKPSFALRALVQERFAEIIATDIAGYQSGIEIKEYTLAVTIQSLKQTADKWLVPRRARRAFRAVAFEALYFVGEHGLITRGADALFQLTPFEFHQIFSPLLAALGDAETMQAWLEHTQALAEVDLNLNNNTIGGGNIGTLQASSATVSNAYDAAAAAAAASCDDEDPPESTTPSRPDTAAPQRKRPPPMIPSLQENVVVSVDRLPGDDAEQELPPIS